MSLSDARKRLFRAHRDHILQQWSGEELIEVVAASAPIYDDKLDRARVADESQRIRHAVDEAIGGTVAWLADIDQYIMNVFGTTQYDQQDRPHTGFDQAYIHRVSRGPAVVVLPRNDRGDLGPYVIAQCLLAKTPVLIRPSPREAGGYAATIYRESLIEAAQKQLGDEAAAAIEQAIQVCPPEQNDRDQLLEDLATLTPSGAQLILFGSDNTIETITDGLHQHDIELEQVIQMGEGTSASVLLDLDRDRIEDVCQHIAESAIFDKGDDCTCTSIVYVQNDLYEPALEAFAAMKERLQIDEHFARVHENEFNAARDLARHHVATAQLDRDALNILELRETDPVYEYPMPVLQIKTIEGSQELLERMHDDLDGGNLVTAVFTDRSDELADHLHEELPSTLVRYNAPTHHIDLLQPHQGIELVRELMAARTVELRNHENSA